ncbi:hypothetical protein X805_41620 [Sphaerotilus natans subsp. natans DSM 6575]|uniref:Uncharacterized protein n=1 Tax=Sphaerotilus natans subsp. natans DSM 6575 TaxID=1286631 RepID=A0A059KFJ5_9BURK|nr:hypothetical protein X805_41620 [Sphaerotilus natans subsp. natans DSM 6575]
MAQAGGAIEPEGRADAVLEAGNGFAADGAGDVGDGLGAAGVAGGGDFHVDVQRRAERRAERVRIAERAAEIDREGIGLGRAGDTQQCGGGHGDQGFLVSDEFHAQTLDVKNLVPKWTWINLHCDFCEKNRYSRDRGGC